MLRDDTRRNSTRSTRKFYWEERSWKRGTAEREKEIAEKNNMLMKRRRAICESFFHALDMVCEDMTLTAEEKAMFLQTKESFKLEIGEKTGREFSNLYSLFRGFLKSKGLEEILKKMEKNQKFLRKIEMLKCLAVSNLREN